MLVVMMLMALVSLSLLISVCRTVARRPEASGYAAPGYDWVLACLTIFLTSPKNMSERDITGPGLPATAHSKI